MTDAESKAVRELISTCERVVSWLDGRAATAEKCAKTPGQAALSHFYESESLIYRTTSANVRKAIKKAAGVLKG